MEQIEALKYKELTPEEAEMVGKMFGVPSSKQLFVRIGPKGYFFTREHCTKYGADIYNMQLKEGDIFVASYQRSGTTWTQELVWLLANNFDYDKAAAIPLVHRYAFLELASFFSEEMKAFAEQISGNNVEIKKVIEFQATPATKILSDMPSPRFAKTHLPMSLLPPKILDTAKVVYVARDPRDVAVSCFHHARLFKLTHFEACFRDLWEAFRNDSFTMTPYFEHVKEAWELRKHPNMLFLFYEDLIKDFPAAIRRVSEFLGKEVSPEQMERLCDHLSIDNFKNNKSVNFEELGEIGLLDTREKFIRKGKSGGWREYFDDQMEQEAARWIASNLRDTDLTFPSINNSK